MHFSPHPSSIAKSLLPCTKTYTHFVALQQFRAHTLLSHPCKGIEAPCRPLFYYYPQRRVCHVAVWDTLGKAFGGTSCIPAQRIAPRSGPNVGALADANARKEQVDCLTEKIAHCKRQTIIMTCWHKSKVYACLTLKVHSRSQRCDAFNFRLLQARLSHGKAFVQVLGDNIRVLVHK